jgi:hypothetical protein
MGVAMPLRQLGPRLGLICLLALAALLRLHHLGAPLADGMHAKQIFVANRARSIARPPFNPLRNALDFLDRDGRRMELTEEIPVYMTLLGLGFRVFGEQEWVGHVLSLLGMLVAIIAFHDLMRREFDRTFALAATALFIASPLSIFYGRAVMPESWMLAGMLAATACYHRFLDGQEFRWLLAAAVTGLLGALFKYYGLMVLIPIAALTVRRGGWRACLGRHFLILAIVMTLPVVAWMALVFARTPNPVSSGWVQGYVYPYLIVQAPWVVLDHRLYRAFFKRFLVYDIGPMTALLLLIGIATALVRRQRLALIGGWTAMGLLFFFGFGPKLIDHDYYELMLLPAVAAWGALGLFQLLNFYKVADGPARKFWIVGVLGLTLIVQSPLFMGWLFDMEWGKPVAAERLAQLTPRTGRVVAMGPGIGLGVIVHYCNREGWPVRSGLLAPDWRANLERYRNSGATHLLLYFGSEARAASRDSYRPLIAAYPVVERRAGPWGRDGGQSEYLILDLLASGPRPPVNLARHQD